VMDTIAGGSLGPSVSMSGTTPLLIGAQKQAMVINPPIDNFGLSYGVSDNQNMLAYDYKKVAAIPALSPTGLADQAIEAAAIADISVVQALAKANKASTYPLESWLDYQLRDIGRLIVGGSGVRAYFAEQGGYDTHSSQELYQPVLLQQLGESMVNFYNYLTAQNVTQEVIVATISDFGRRPAANLDFGTDHGGATVSFVFGNKVKGGVYGTYPSLKKFDKNGNLAINIDFRNVLSDLIVGIGGNPTPILGQTYPSLGFL
jgi:uncharacterized protein (DUF1501 family)